MKEVTNHTRLHSRKGTKNYHFRTKVLIDLQDIYRKKEITYCLCTAENQEALEKVRVEYLRLDQEFTEVRRNLTKTEVQKLSQVESERLAAIPYSYELKGDEDSGPMSTASFSQTLC